MTRLLGTLLLSFALLAAAGAEQRLLLDSCDSTRYWRAYPGSEFPGATVAVEAVTDEARGGCVEGQVRFAEESRYAALEWRGRVDECAALGFRIFLADRTSGIIRVRDAGDQVHNGGFQATRGAWSEVVVPLTPAGLPNHWAGANDGRIRWPLKEVWIGVYRGPDVARWRISDLFLVRADGDAEPALSAVVEPGVRAGIALLGEPVTYRVEVLNRLDQAQRYQLRVEAAEADAEPTVVHEATGEVAGWSRQSASFALDTRAAGYRALRAVVTTAAGPPAVAESGLAVVPPPRYPGRPAPQGYFGIQSGVDYEAAARLGIKAVRLFLHWRWFEPQPGRYDWAAQVDPLLAAARQHGYALLITLNAVAPSWIGWQRADKPRAINLPDPARWAEYTRFARDVAAHCRGQVAAIEVQNEPDLMCVSHPELSFEEGVDYYVQMLRAGRAGIKQGDPDVPVAAIDVSGVDLDKGLPFTKAVLAQAADQVDLYTGHPYASPRNFGPGLHPKFPLTNRMDSKLRDALDLVAAHGRPRRAWVGELGWALRTTCAPLSRYGLDHAGCVAQSLIVGKSVPGVERHLYFTFEGCNESGHEYGLTRGDPRYAMPAAAAYAQCAQLLEDTTPVELAEAGPGLRRATFACPQRDELICAWWTEGEDVAVALAPGAPAGRWTDSLFRTPPIRGGRVVVGRLPVYHVVPLRANGERPTWLAAMREAPPADVVIRAAALARVGAVTLALTNHSAGPRTLQATVDGRTQPVTVAPGEGSYQVPLAAPLGAGDRAPLKLALADGDQVAKRELPASLRALAAVPAGARVDGDATEAPGPWIEVSERRDVLPPDGTVGWNGPADLSFRVCCGADAQRLWIWCRVTDDQTTVGRVDSGGYWQSDSLQLGLDLDRDGGERFTDRDRELGFVLAPDGPRAWLGHPGPAKQLPGVAAARRVGTETVWEIALPWSALGLSAPVKGQVIGLNLIANDNDGQGRGYWIGLTPGLGEAKTPTAWHGWIVP